MYKKNKLTKWILIVMMPILIASCSILPEEEGELKAPLVQPKEESYNTAVAEVGTILKEISGTGLMESVDTDYSQFESQGGRVKKIYVKSGDKVKKGDRLIQLDVEGMDINIKEQAIAISEIEWAYKNLKKNGASAEEIKIAKQKVELENMKYDRLQELLESREIRAGISGQIIFVEDLEPGDFVEQYQTLVITADVSKLRLALKVDTSNSEISDVKIGMSASVTINGADYQGEVVQTPSSAPTTMNKEMADRYAKSLYINVKDIPSSTEVGQMADVKITTLKRENVLKIPKRGVRKYLNQTFVQVLEEGNLLREFDVQTGIEGGTEVEIVEGLKAGQTIVLQ